MNQGTVQHPGHDLHVPVRMGLEPGAGRDGVVVADDEHAMVGIGPERVDSGVERVASVQPSDPGLMTIAVTADTYVRPSDRGRTHAGLLRNYLMNQVNS